MRENDKTLKCDCLKMNLTSKMRHLWVGLLCLRAQKCLIFAPKKLMVAQKVPNPKGLKVHNYAIFFL